MNAGLSIMVAIWRKNSSCLLSLRILAHLLKNGNGTYINTLLFVSVIVDPPIILWHSVMGSLNYADTEGIGFVASLWISSLDRLTREASAGASMVQLPKPHLLIHPSTGSHGLEFIHIINSTSSLEISYTFDTHFLDNFNPPTPQERYAFLWFSLGFTVLPVHFPPPTTSLTAKRLASKQLRHAGICSSTPKMDPVTMTVPKPCSCQHPTPWRCVDGWDGWDFLPGKKGDIFFREKKTWLY